MLRTRLACSVPRLCRPSSTAPSWAPQLLERREAEDDQLSLRLIRSLVSTIETEGLSRDWNSGDRLPEGWTLLAFAPVDHPSSSLLPDGTDHGSYHPPLPGLERMWVSGSFTYPRGGAPLLVDDKIRCESQVESIKEREGKDGRKGWYVEQVRKISRLGQGGEKQTTPSVVERRTHLYRFPLPSDNAPGSATSRSTTVSVPKERKEPSFYLPFIPTQEILFRFSALTFNGHRIHLDENYCRDVEKKQGLVVHGPLTSLLLLNTLRHNLSSSPSASSAKTPRISNFSYRATLPLIVNTPVRYCGRWVNEGQEEGNCEMWAEDGKGNVYMTATGKVEL